MCQSCPSDSPQKPTLPRRNFFKLAAAATAGVLISDRLLAAAPSTPPKPANVVTPDEALARLVKGNKRYIAGTTKRHDFQSERPALALGQNPFAGILSCADSRVAPEYAFDTGRGDLFVCRVAGNFASRNIIASFEYGVAVLGVPLILVLGHGSCGAISSTIKEVTEGTKFPGHIDGLLDNLEPAVEAVLRAPGDLLANATLKNVLLTVAELKKAGPILNKAVQEGRLKIVGGIYDLHTGRVNLVG